jgi:outer membrane protein TolC
MKNRILLLSFLLSALFAHAQNATLTLAQCDSLAEKNYPLLRQQDLIEQSKTYTLENASKGYYPQISINGQATYQSQVLAIPIEIPGFTIETPGKDQYKVYGEIVQPLTDLYTVGQQKDLYAANADIQQQSLQVELYKLKERVHQLFFGILLVDEQLEQTVIKEKDLNSGIAKINATIQNGTAYKSSADVLKAELLSNKQRAIELRSTRKAYTEMLGLFINQQLNEEVKLIKPPFVAYPVVVVKRPELFLFDLQRRSYDIQNRLLTAKTLPKFSLFLQGGFGRPAFNAFSNSFDPYYIGGLRLSWSLSNYFTLKNERKIIGINQSLLDVQRETFVFNTNLTMRQQSSEITRLQEMIIVDNEIIVLRTNIKNTAAVQLENGVIASNDYLREVNAEDQSKQNLLLHQVQLLMAAYNFQYTTGN